MKKTALIFTVMMVTAMIVLPVLFSIKAVEAASTGSYIIGHVNHRIEVIYNGYVFINDTITIVGNASSGNSLSRFLIGFPYVYGSHVIRCVAYNASKVFNVTLDVSLEDRMGFYGVEIDFPQPLDISKGRTHNFTVGFLLSQNLLTQDVTNTSRYTLNFPAYPSLTQPATVCNVSIVLPATAQYISGTVDAFNYWEENLPEFAYSPANVTFLLTSNDFQMFDVNELKREIRISETGEIEGSDSYYIKNKASKTISIIEVILPSNVSSTPVAYDQFGRKIGIVEFNAQTGRCKVSFTSSLEGYRSTRFTIKYRLSPSCIIQNAANNFNITFFLFKNLNYYIVWSSVTVIFPEGAKMSSFETSLIGVSYTMTRSVFQETLTIYGEDISNLESILPSENALMMVYEYNPLWLSFRPTLWMWALALVGCTVVFVWKRPKAPAHVVVPTVAIRLSQEHIKSFIDSYENKRKALLELESIEVRVRKGKIPRRRYKVQRKTLETRLQMLSRKLTELKEKMRVAGGHYMELMRQLEIAETEINEIEANIKSIEARHSRGELSLEAHRKLLADYQRRKEEANTKISGILLRLREEIR